MNKLKKKMSTIAAIAAASTIALSMIGTSASAISPAEQDGAILASYGGNARSASSYTDAYGNHVTVITTNNGTETYVNGEREQAVNAQTVFAVEKEVAAATHEAGATNATALKSYEYDTYSYTVKGDTGAIYTTTMNDYGQVVTYRNGESFMVGAYDIYAQATYCDDIIKAQSNAKAVGAQNAKAQADAGYLRGKAAMEQEAARSNAITTANQTANTPASNNNVTQPVTTRTATAGGILVVTTTKDSSGRVTSTSHMEQPRTNAEIRAVQNEKNKAASSALSTSTASSPNASANRNTASTTTATNNNTSSTRTATAGGILVVTTTTDSRGRVISTTSRMEQPVGTAEIKAVQRERNKATSSSTSSTSSSATSNGHTSTSSANRNTSTSSSSASTSSTSSSYNAAQQAAQQRAAQQAAAGAARGAAAMAQYASSSSSTSSSSRNTSTSSNSSSSSSKSYNSAQQAGQQKAAEQAAAGAARGAAAMAQYANKK